MAIKSDMKNNNGEQKTKAVKLRQQTTMATTYVIRVFGDAGGGGNQCLHSMATLPLSGLNILPRFERVLSK